MANRGKSKRAKRAFKCPTITASERLKKSRRDEKRATELGLRRGTLTSSSFARWNGSASIESARGAHRHGVG